MTAPATTPCRTTRATTAPRRTSSPNVICVAATDQNDVLASFSNYGATSVDLAAPGVGVTSTWPAYHTLYTQGFEDPFSSWLSLTRSPRLGAPLVHANGAFSMSDSPGGNYVPGPVTQARAPGPPRLRASADGSAARRRYNLRFDAQPFEDFSGSVELSNDGFVQLLLGSGWSGSSRGSFLSLTSDFSVFDNSPSISVLELIMHANGDGSTLADGGFLDDLRLRCLRPNAEDYNTISGKCRWRRRMSPAWRRWRWRRIPPTRPPSWWRRSSAGPTRCPSLSGKVATGGRLNACKAVGGDCPAVAPPPFRPPARGAEGDRREAPHGDPSKIKAKHCRLGKVTYVASTAKRKGKVLRETPKAGKHLARRAKVNLWVGRGPKRK